MIRFGDLSRQAAIVLEGLELHMLYVHLGRVQLTTVEDPRIDVDLHLADGRRVTEWVAATCRLIERPQLQRLTFERHDRWGEVQRTATCEYALAAESWTIVIRVHSA